MLKIIILAAAAVLFTGCQSIKLSSEDYSVPQKFQKEIAVLHSNRYLPNSKEKYEAAKVLYDNIDFSYTKDISTLDKIFTTLDAKVTSRNPKEQTIIFTYEYRDKFVRFVFARYNDLILSSEVSTEKDTVRLENAEPVFRAPDFKPPTRN